MDLLQSDILAGAAAFSGWEGLVPDVRAVWATPIAGEEDAPARRIIHSRIVQLHSPARLHRLGLKPAIGYTKCGSRVQIDRIASFRVLIWDGTRWTIHRVEQFIQGRGGEEPVWFDLGGIIARSVIIEGRSCEIDGWWTSWNLVQGAFFLEGDVEGHRYPQKEQRLTPTTIDVSRTPAGVEVLRLPGELRFRTDGYEVGFWLGRAGFSYLALHEHGVAGRNLLRTSPAVALQGPMLRPVGAAPAIASLLRYDVTGSVSFREGTLTYDVRSDELGVEYVLEWTMKNDAFGFRMVRRGERDLHAWESSVWKIVFDSEIIPPAVIGRITRNGETGLMTFPILLDAPGHGTVHVSSTDGNGLCRSDSHRPLTFTSCEFKVGEIPQPEGDYLLPKGEFVLEGEISPFTPGVKVSGPHSVVEAVRKRIVSAITYRADTATMTNNGNSMHAPLCMDNWSAIATRVHIPLPGASAIDLLRDSLERWLDGGPGYASGGMMTEGKRHVAEDEYIMTGTAGLLGLAEFLHFTNDRAWLQFYRPRISLQIELMKKRDLDGDGLVESPFRSGVSGGHEWSTNWYDVISFGWKDAFANALLCRALDLLGDVFESADMRNAGIDLHRWAKELRSHYFDTFFNLETGWLGGWRDKQGHLHDYAFLFVNGAAVCNGAVDESQARLIIGNIWKEAQRIGLPAPRLGLPGNLWPIPDQDMAVVMHGKPMGYYLNGALTHSQSRHFVGALYAVGMHEQGDLLLSGLCESLADGAAFGGCNSGVDWRYWDGAPCGYEGILTDQFGILAVAIDRYGMR